MCIRDRYYYYSPLIPQNYTLHKRFVTQLPNPIDHHLASIPVSYTHLRAHETPEHLVCRLLLDKKHDVLGLLIGLPCDFFFNDTATTEIYTRSLVGSVRCV